MSKKKEQVYEKIKSLKYIDESFKSVLCEICDLADTGGRGNTKATKKTENKDSGGEPEKK